MVNIVDFSIYIIYIIYNMNKLSVYTVITGKDKLYDKIHKQNFKFKENIIDYYLFTDNKTLKSNYFKVIYVKSKLPSKILSRDIKINVHKYLPNYKKTLYLDGNVKINNYLSKLLNNMESDIETFSITRNIKEEAEWIKKKKYCSEEILKKKLKEYANQGFNLEKSQTLYGKIILRKGKSKKLNKFSETWFKEYKIISRDQLSLPYCIWKYGISHKTLGNKKLNIPPYNQKIFKKYFIHMGAH